MVRLPLVCNTSFDDQRTDEHIQDRRETRETKANRFARSPKSGSMKFDGGRTKDLLANLDLHRIDFESVHTSELDDSESVDYESSKE